MAIKYFVGNKLISEADVPAYSGSQVTAFGMSTDAKPEHMNDCDFFYEKDTGKVYIYDTDTTAWLEQ